MVTESLWVYNTSKQYIQLRLYNNRKYFKKIKNLNYVDI